MSFASVVTLVKLYAAVNDDAAVCAVICDTVNRPGAELYCARAVIDAGTF